MSIVIKTPLNYFDKNLKWNTNSRIGVAKLSNSTDEDATAPLLFTNEQTDYLCIVGSVVSNMIQTHTLTPIEKRNSEGTIYLKISKTCVTGYVVIGQVDRVIFVFPNVQGTYIEMCSKDQSNQAKIEL